MKICSWALFLGALSAAWGSQNASAQPLKKLPIDVSSFKVLQENDYVYVDKTEQINSLIQSERRCFLVRPHRFGVTLFLSTLQAIFSGNKNLFKNCWIGLGDRYDWPVYPVIKLDFLAVDDTYPDTFEKCLLYKINLLAQEAGVVLPKDSSLETATKELIKTLSERGKIVFLVDSYDKPLRRHQADKEAFEKIKQVLVRFYGVIGKFDEYFRFIIITGVVPYAATLLFSSIPQLQNISFSSHTDAIFGFANEEIGNVLLPYVERFAQQANKSSIAIIHALNDWYGGYRFALQGKTVCCPVPLLYSLHRGEKDPYWFETITPTFLVQFMKTFPDAFHNQTTWEVPLPCSQNCDGGGLTPASALWYAGYLTISPEQGAKGSYTLIAPNQSTVKAFNELLSMRGRMQEVPC